MGWFDEQIKQRRQNDDAVELVICAEDYQR